MTRVTVWCEDCHDRYPDAADEAYPDGIHAAIADGLRRHGYDPRTATLREPEHGLTESVVADTDVLVWWGHVAHDEVADAVVDRVCAAVRDGMGLIALHSAHHSKVFRRLMGTSCDLKWRESGERERIWVVEPGHPIAAGLDECLELSRAEMYGERFDVPTPDGLVFVSWFEGGEVFRSGCCYRRGAGRVFYFRPGHQTYPIFHRDDVRQVLANAVEWAAPAGGPDPAFGNYEPRE